MAQSAPAARESEPPGRTAPVLLDVQAGVATVTLNRAEAMNALDVATKVGLRDTLAAVAADADVRCVVLTGKGRAFCVGQDLKEHLGPLRAGDREALATTVQEHYNPVVTSLLTMPKPVVAAVNGVAAGAGASLAMACDYRLLAETAGFNLAFAGIALSADTAATWTLQQLVGRTKALELLFEPRTIPASEALQLGLATKVVPGDRLVGETAALTQRLAQGPTAAYGAIRRAVTYSATHGLAESLAFEADMMELTGATEDHRNAVESFLAKQPPTFTGR